MRDQLKLALDRLQVLEEDISLKKDDPDPYESNDINENTSLSEEDVDQPNKSEEQLENVESYLNDSMCQGDAEPSQKDIIDSSNLGNEVKSVSPVIPTPSR